MSAPARARAESARARAPAERRAPRETRPDLRLVPTQPGARRARRRQARVTLALAACVVAGALLVVAAGNSVVVSQQVRLDTVRAQVASALAQDQDLQVQRALLESPARILSIAEHRLGMVTPPAVRYLSPVTTGRPVPPARPASPTRSTPTRR